MPRLPKKNHCLDLLLLLLIFSRVPASKGMQIPWDISALRAPETSELAALIALTAIFPCSSAWTLLGKYKPPFPGLIPISRPSGTLLSWKKDAVDCNITNSNTRITSSGNNLRWTSTQQRFLAVFFGRQKEFVFFFSIFTWSVIWFKYLFKNMKYALTRQMEIIRVREAPAMQELLRILFHDLYYMSYEEMNTYILQVIQKSFLLSLDWKFRFTNLATRIVKKRSHAPQHTDTHFYTKNIWRKKSRFLPQCQGWRMRTKRN